MGQVWKGKPQVREPRSTPTSLCPPAPSWSRLEDSYKITFHCITNSVCVATISRSGASVDPLLSGMNKYCSY
jgi:hypothetical protein